MASGAGVSTIVVVGTGSDLTISKLGFRPRWVRVVKVTSTQATLEWMDTMADDSGFKQVGGTMSVITIDGITPTDDGFILGADSAINVSGHTLHIVAAR